MNDRPRTHREDAPEAFATHERAAADADAAHHPPYVASLAPVAFSPYDVVSARASVARAATHGLARTALTLGISAMLLCWMPVLALVFGGVATACGIAALRRRQSAAMAVWGLVLGAVAATVNLIVTGAIIITIMFFTFLVTELSGLGPSTDTSAGVVSTLTSALAVTTAAAPTLTPTF